MTYLLDTNICIAVLKGTEPQLRKQLDLLALVHLAICSVVKAELLYGARKSQNTSAMLTLLEHFLKPLSSFDFDDKAAAFYGINRVLLEKAGTPIGERDLMIASIAMANDLCVVTRNQREFNRVPGLKTEIW